MHVCHLLPLCSATLSGTGRERSQLGVCHGLQLIVQELEEKATGKNELLNWLESLDL